MTLAWTLKLIASVVVLGVPLLSWWFHARTRDVGLAVGAALGACMAATLVLVSGWFDSGEWDVVARLAYAPVTAAVIAYGVRLERFSIGARPARNPRTGTTIMVLYVALAACCGTPGWWFANGEVPGGPPSAGEVLPLPERLSVVGDDTGCGSAMCGRTVVVAGADGVPAETVPALVRGHLAGRGWHVDVGREHCRRRGWLFDGSETCVGMSVDGGQVSIQIDRWARYA